jgi:NAD(P)-dependent dehydrogenase (short-subunit alcohol dehydrogenase family)
VERLLGSDYPGLLRFTVGLAETTTLLFEGKTEEAYEQARKFTDFAESAQPGRAIGEVLLAQVLLARGETALSVTLTGFSSAMAVITVPLYLSVASSWFNLVGVDNDVEILPIAARVLAITLTSPFLFSKHAAKAMIAAGHGGKIVNVSSTSGYFGRDKAVAYTAAKGGVVNLTKSLAIQLAPHKIRVNAVVPNKIGSPVGKDEFDPTRPVLNLVGRPGVPVDLARAALFLVSDDSEFIVGTALFVDGGCTTLMPGNA